MNKRILVTGGSGYIGSLLCSKLTAQGYPLSVLDNLDFSKSILSSLKTDPSFHYIQGDIRDTNRINESLEDAEV